jgi:hypothetical protein
VPSLCCQPFAVEAARSGNLIGESRMHKFLAGSALLALVLASLLFGPSGTTPASAAVNYNSWSGDVVYVYDMTSRIKRTDGAPYWPVSAAAERWDNDNPVDYRYTTTPCPAAAQCVIVRQAELASPTVGLTVLGRVGTDIRSATVTLDTTFGRTTTNARRRNVVCHELGHALGLQHRTATSSCLTSYAANQQYPDATDIKNLNIMYR